MNRLLTGTRLQVLIPLLGLAAGIAVVFSVLPATAAQPGTKAKESSSPGDEASKVLVKLDDDWSAAAGTKDAARMASFYAEDAVAYPPGEPVCIGRAAAQKVWAAYFTDPTFTISWKTAHAGVAKSGEMGFTSGPYEATFTGPDGKLVHEKGKYLCTWSKGPDGTWKAAHDMWNADSR